MTATKVTGVYLHPNGRYYLRYSLRGKDNWRSLKTRVFSEAKHMAEAERPTINRQRLAPEREANPETMGDLAEIYSNQAACLATSSIANAKSAIGRLREYWPGGGFDQATPSAVNDVTVTSLRTGLLAAGYANGTVNMTLSALRALLEIGRLHHIVHEDLFAKRARRRIYLKPEHRVPVMPSRAEMEKVFDFLLHPLRRLRVGADDPASTPEVWNPPFAQRTADHARFMAYTGMRVSEANAVNWDDIVDQWNPEKNRWEGNVYVRGVKKGARKTEAAKRPVPILQPLRDLLHDMRARYLAKGKPCTGGLFEVKTSLKSIAAACAKAKIATLHQHDLRHYFTTFCLEDSTVAIPTIAAWLGHKDGGALLQRTYGHLRQDVSFDAAASISRRFESPVAPVVQMPSPVASTAS